MFKSLIILFLLLFAQQSVAVKQPDWIDFEQRQKVFPSNQYFTGFAWKEVKDKKGVSALFETLKDYATSELTESVQVTVESVSTLNTIEVNKEVHEQFKVASTSFSKVDLTGLQTKTWYNKKKKIAYSLAYIDKSDLVKYYEGQINQDKEKLDQLISLAEEFDRSGDQETALETYLECMPVLHEIDAAITMIILIRASVYHSGEISKYENKVRQGIAKIQKSSSLSLDEVCHFMANALQLQTGKIEKPIILGNITYEDTRMGSSFSRRFSKIFEQELISEGKFSIISGEAISNISATGNFLVLSGTYWEEGDQLKIITLLKNPANNNTLAGIDGQLSLDWFSENNVEFMPQNFEEAMADMKAFSKDEIIGGGLLLDLWTDKIVDNPIYTGGEIMKIFIRVNQPCYIRFIYHLADGTKTLLLDNYYIDQSKVNQAYEIPDHFECSGPFGVETLQVIAQSKPFNKLITVNESGYEIIRDDTQGILENSRGMKRMKNEDLKAEKRIMITTMKK